jgi:prephenate dehydrogenase
VRQWLAGAADVRRALPAQWVPATARLRELSVPVNDQPGVVGVVTTAVSRAGCNIEDIEIDHQSEDSAVLRLVLTDEGDSDGLVAELEARGFSPHVRPLDDEGA